MSGETYYPRHSELDTEADRELDAAQERIRELEEAVGFWIQAATHNADQRDEARVEVLSIAQQLELEREASAQLRAEVGERMRETAEAQRQACADFMASERWYTTVGCLSAPLVTEDDEEECDEMGELRKAALSRGQP
jgi:hypothetical protein